MQFRLEILRLRRVLCGLTYNILKNVLYIFRFLYYINTKIRLYGYYYRTCSIRRYTNTVHLFDCNVTIQIWDSQSSFQIFCVNFIDFVVIFYMFLYNKNKICVMYMHLKYTLYVVLTSLSHYRICIYYNFLFNTIFGSCSFISWRDNFNFRYWNKTRNFKHRLA